MYYNGWIKHFVIVIVTCNEITIQPNIYMY